MTAVGVVVPKASFAALNWRSLYQQALLESDPSRISSCIQAAEELIIERSRELACFDKFSEEDTELTTAILALCDLRRNNHFRE